MHDTLFSKSGLLKNIGSYLLLATIAIHLKMIYLKILQIEILFEILKRKLLAMQKYYLWSI